MAKLLQMTLLFEPAQETEPEQEAEPLVSSRPEPDNFPVASPVWMEEAAPPDHDIPDADARAQALDIRRSWIVEAPAGSGKTGLLIQRFLKLLAWGEVTAPREVLAITFTRKADAEMRHRVIDQLTAAAMQLPLPRDAGAFAHTTRQMAEAVLARDRALGWRLLDNPRQLNIRTIDSLCAELASSLPVLAGAGGRYRPVEDATALFEAAAERTLLRMDGEDPGLTADLRRLLLLRDARPSEFITLLAGMLRQREQWGELLPLDLDALTDEALDTDVRPRLDRTLRLLVERELAAAAEQLGPGCLETMANLAHDLAHCPAVEGAHPFALCAELPVAPGPVQEELPHWLCLVDLLLTKDGKWRASLRRNHLRVEVTPELQQRLEDLLRTVQLRAEAKPTLRETLCHLRLLPIGAYPEEQWEVVKSLCRVLRQGLLELQLLFAERRQCDFTEVGLTARQLFSAEGLAPDLLRASVGDLRHLLVDEMQDTSAGQYRLLEQLTSSWDGVTQTVFLVGDPKQSIYEFRQARVERFLRVMQEGRLNRLPLGALRLTANFRSQAALVDDFNAVFGEILPAPEQLAQESENGEVPFVRAVAIREADQTPALYWHAALAQPTPLTGAEPELEELQAPDREARALRVAIEDFLERWPTLGRDRRPRIAVLARARSHFAPVIEELRRNREHGPIPFRAVDIESLAQRPEILDLLALTRALLQPADRIAWLAVLRSPLCGLGLADLLALTGEGPEADRSASIASLVDLHTQKLSPEGQLRLARCWPVLTHSVADLGRTSIRTHVERTWRSLGGDAPLRAPERTNARRYLELLDRLEAETDGLSLAMLTRRLGSLYAAPSAEPADVDLMTIHKAKGLEWDLVLVPDLQRSSGRDSHEFLKWFEFDSSEEAGFLLAPIQGKGELTSALSRWLTHFQTAREAAEAKRLLYVACTRAREELHLFGTVCRKRQGELALPRPGSLLRAAWPAAEPVFRTQLELLASNGRVLSFPDGPSTASSIGTSLALAASADVGSLEVPPAAGPGTPKPSRPTVARLPLWYEPESHFDTSQGAGLPYAPASVFPTAATFERPEGSFAARAFGNVVHRFLPQLSDRLAAGIPVPALLAVLPSWQARVLTALRSEGLPAAVLRTELERALAAMQGILTDPHGLWLLSPHREARNEAGLPMALEAEPTSRGAAKLRADRTFLAGDTPENGEDASCLWIIDYKTAELGNRPRDRFLAEQREKYRSQMEAYAAAAGANGFAAERLRLALYFPLLPALLFWSPSAAG